MKPCDFGYHVPIIEMYRHLIHLSLRNTPQPIAMVGLWKEINQVLKSAPEKIKRRRGDSLSRHYPIMVSAILDSGNFQVIRSDSQRNQVAVQGEFRNCYEMEKWKTKYGIAICQIQV